MTILQELINEFENIKQTKCKTLQETIFFDGVLSIIESKYLAKEKKWIDVEKHKPNAYEKGNWDGLRTDFMLIHTISGNITKARAYIGFLDGSDFCDWYAENDFQIHEKVTHFMNLPESPFF